MNVSSVTNHFSTANKGFITTLGSSILAGATTIPLTSVSGLTNATVFVGIIEPGLPNEQEFTGTVDTAGVQITGVKWTDGTNVDHTAGVTIVDYVAATDWNMLTKGLLVSHDQDGTLKADSVDVTAVIKDAVITRPKLASGFASEFTTGWVTGDLPAVSTVTANGNRSYDIGFASTVASTLSSGMRLKTTRTVAAPTQCTSLNGTTQYYSKTSPNKLTFTDDFVVSAWVKLSSYANGIIVSRYNGTSGWYLYVTAAGLVQLTGHNAGAGNASYVASYQSLPLNKWVHVTAQLDMSAFTATTTTSYIMFDGKDIPAQVTRIGTNPTALVQAGNLEIGSYNGGSLPFAGKIAQVAIYNAKVTQATILASISQGLSGSETSLASAYSFNNSIADLNTTTPNDLTAQGSAVATNDDSPFTQGPQGVPGGTEDYALIMRRTSATAITVQVPEGCTIPTSGGITSVSYSTQANPYGWPEFTPTTWHNYLQQNVSVTTEVSVGGISFYVAKSGYYELTIEGLCQNTSAATHTTRIRQDSPSGTIIFITLSYIAAATATEGIGFSARKYLTAGHYNYIVTHQAAAGTGTFYSDPTAVSSYIKVKAIDTL